MNIAHEIIKTANKTHSHRGGGWRSVTELIDSPYIAKLRREHPAEVAEHRSKDVGVWALFGTATHHILEMATQSLNFSELQEMITERFFSCEVAGKVITGTADLLYKTNDKWTLSDWKTTSVWSVIYLSKLKDWTAQLNIYAYFARKEGLKIENLEIFALLKDWNRTKARFDANYPQSELFILPIEIWTDEECYNYIAERIQAHEEALVCTPEQRFADVPKYKVFKGSNVRALRVFDNKEDAQNYLEINNPIQKNSLRIEEFAGNEYRRCDDYCDVCEVCPFYKARENNA